MIGHFIELGLPAPNMLEMVGFYEDLGFRQLRVGEVYSHHYAVVSDGTIHIGLHGTALPAPLMTFVLPGLAEEVSELRSRGVRFTVAHTGDDEFNELLFTGPDGHHVRIVEARTYSPPPFEQQDLSLCGRFREITLPVRDIDTADTFWKRLGFEELDQADDPYPHAWLRGEGILLGLHQTRDIDQLALSFYTPDLNQRLAALDARGISPEPGGAPPGMSLLRDPGGLPILLHGA